LLPLEEKGYCVTVNDAKLGVVHRECSWHEKCPGQAASPV
jgi:hypothetical protein